MQFLFSQAYAGHQFGHFTILGDGRAHILGEHISPDGKRYDIQLKGSGQTPYSRRGDGRAVLGPMLREYIISEAMHYLGVPTTRSLAVVSTGENVRRESNLPGAILTRLASSHIRIGTFEFAAATGNIDLLERLLNYTINRHYPEIKNNENKALIIKRVNGKANRLNCTMDESRVYSWSNEYRQYYLIWRNYRLRTMCIYGSL